MAATLRGEEVNLLPLIVRHARATSFHFNVNPLSPEQVRQTSLAISRHATIFHMRLKETIARLATGKPKGLGKLALVLSQSFLHPVVMHVRTINAKATAVKIWTSQRDDRVRPAHWDADGQEQPLAEPFIVDDEELFYPGDPNGSPGNVINCRCYITFDEK